MAIDISPPCKFLSSFMSKILRCHENIIWSLRHRWNTSVNPDRQIFIETGLSENFHFSHLIFSSGWADKTELNVVFFWGGRGSENVTRKSSCVNARGIPPAVSTPSAVLTRYPPPPSWPGQVGYPPTGRVPPGRVPPGQGTPSAGYHPQQGTPLGRVPPLPSRVPPGQGTPWPGQGGTLPGYPLAGYPLGRVSPGRVPPGQGTLPAGPSRVPPRCLPHGILGNVAKHYGMWVPPQVSAPWYSG